MQPVEALHTINFLMCSYLVSEQSVHPIEGNLVSQSLLFTPKVIFVTAAIKAASAHVTNVFPVFIIIFLWYHFWLSLY